MQPETSEKRNIQLKHPVLSILYDESTICKMNAGKEFIEQGLKIASKKMLTCRQISRVRKSKSLSSISNHVADFLLHCL